MSREHYRGSAYAVQQLMKLAEKDCAEGGEIKPALRKWKVANPAKVLIGGFKARVLRLKRVN